MIFYCLLRIGHFQVIGKFYIVQSWAKNVTLLGEQNAKNGNILAQLRMCYIAIIINMCYSFVCQIQQLRKCEIRLQLIISRIELI